MNVKTTYMETVKKGLRRNPTKRAVVLISGGVESVSSAILLNSVGYEVYGLFINYSQPNYDAERLCVDMLKDMEYIKEVREVELDLLQMREWPLTDDQAFVPARNTVFLSMAGAYAGLIDADCICIGMMEEDIGVFGDNDPTHHAIMQALLTHSLGRELKVVSPTRAMSKSALIEMCRRENVLTVSCWNAKVGEDPLKGGGGKRLWIETCGECAQCLERKQYE